jgi:multidrug efflux pump subunit AcrB
MNRAIAWFAINPVAANLLLLLIVLGGAVTIPSIPREVYPEMSGDSVTVSVEYRGAAPAEVESAVCIRIEEKLLGVDGIDRVTSVAREGSGVVTAELLSDADPRRVLDDIKARVDAIDTFPGEVEKPVIKRDVKSLTAIELAVFGDADEHTLGHLGRQIRDEISTLPGVTRVDMRNARPYEVSIEISEPALRRYGLTFDAVARAIRRSSLDLPGGSIRSPTGEVLLRTKGQAYRGADFARIPILTRDDGTRLTVADVATVVDGFEDVDRWARFNGQPAVMIRVFRVGRQNVLKITETVEAYLEELRLRLPDGVSVTPWAVQSEMLRGRLATLLENGRNGFFLVLVVLALFLRLRVAFWILFGLPLCFLGTLWLMPAFGVTLNSNSVFAFIIVLGILVDDAIVIGENIYTHHESKGWSPRAAIDGTQEVALPVVFGVLTTVAAFAPLLLIPGMMGRLMAPLPICIILALGFSLLESTLILPSHLAHGRDRDPSTARFAVQRLWRSMQGSANRGLQWVINSLYRPALATALTWRYTTLATAVSVLLVTVAALYSGQVNFVFIPSIGGDHVITSLSMPLGTPSSQTAKAMEHLELTAMQLAASIDAGRDNNIIKFMYTAIGEQQWGSGGNRSPVQRGIPGAHLGEMVIELVEEDERAVSADELMRRWRDAAGTIAGAVDLTFSAKVISAGAPINIQLRGPNTADLKTAAAQVREHLAGYPGLVDITDTFRGGKRELQLDILPAAETLGLNLSDLGRQVRQAFYGEEVQRIQRGRDEVRVMLRYPPEQRRSLADIENMYVRTRNGGEVPFRSVARVSPGTGFAAISRTDRQRTVDVVTDIEPGGNANAIISDLNESFLPRLLATYPGMTYSFEGEQREQGQTLDAIRKGMLLALVAIFALLSIPLRSYVQPLLIMAAIPFGMIGAVIGHVLLGHPLSMPSLMGVVALAGVVVNDSLVLVSYVNAQRRKGVSLTEAVRNSGAARFRPILLTSLTTFAGLLPIMTETSFQAQFLIPMAISLAFGVLFATVVTLLLVPALYLILEDLRAISARTSRTAQTQTPAKA